MDNKANVEESLSPDHSACEGFFGRLKHEMSCNRKLIGVSLEGFVQILDACLHWYNEKRIKVSLGSLSPLDYRKKLGFTA